MDQKKLLATLETEFIRITNEGDLYEKGTVIYVKEIKDGIFLLFNVLESKKKDPIQAIIANFDCLESIGVKKPIQLLFHLTINSNDDLHYLNKYLSSTA